MVVILQILVLLGLLGLLMYTPVYTESIDLTKIEQTKLRLNDIRSTMFNEGQPIVFSGKLTSISGEPIPKAEIVIKSDGTCPSDGIIAKEITDKHGRYWIYTLAKIWDPTDNLIKIHAEYFGDEFYSPSYSQDEVIVVFPISGDSC